MLHLYQSKGKQNGKAQIRQSATKGTSNPIQ